MGESGCCDVCSRHIPPASALKGGSPGQNTRSSLETGNKRCRQTGKGDPTPKSTKLLVRTCALFLWYCLVGTQGQLPDPEVHIHREWKQNRRELLFLWSQELEKAPSGQRTWEKSLEFLFSFHVLSPGSPVNTMVTRQVPKILTRIPVVSRM